MTANDVLPILKYGGFIISALSGVWALIAKTTFEDAQGQKRLTPSGHISIAIIVSSALISMLAFGFETLSKQDQARVEEDKEVRRAENERRNRIEDKLEIERSRSQILQIAQVQDAKRRAENAEQRVLFISTASEQKTREAETARKVSEGTERNLLRTQKALAQLERVLNPIGIPEISAVWTLDDRTPGIQPLIERLTEFASRLRANPELEKSTPGIFVNKSSIKGPEGFSFATTSPLFPDKTSEREVYTVLTGVGAELSFFSESSTVDAIKEIVRNNGGNLGFFSNAGDLGIDIGSDSKFEIRYDFDIDKRSIDIWIQDAPDKEGDIRKTGKISSVIDLEKSILAIRFSTTMVPSIGGSYPNLMAARKHAFPSTIFLKAGGREYIIQEFTPISVKGILSPFLSRSVGSGRYP